MNEMFVAADSAGGDGDELRNRILRYLERSEYDEGLDAVTESSAVGGLSEMAPIFDEVISAQHAASLRGAVGRRLTSYPDVPGLLLLRAYAEAMAADCDQRIVAENLNAGFDFAFNRYALAPELIAQAAGELITALGRRTGAAEQAASVMLGAQWASREFMRATVRGLPRRLAEPFAARLNSGLALKCRNMRDLGGRDGY